MSYARLRHLLLGVMTLSLAAYPVSASAQCTKDTDCKGDRLCVKGVCVDPPGRTVETSTGTSVKPPGPAGNTSAAEVTPGSNPLPVARRGNRETANPLTLEQLRASMERDQEAVFAVRRGLKEVHKWGEVGSHELVVRRGLVEFRAKGSADIFRVPPEKILSLDRETKLWRLRMKVAVSDQSGGKEKVQTYDLFHPGVMEIMRMVSCTGCDDSMDVLYAVLQTARGQDYEAAFAKSREAARNEELAKLREKAKRDAEAAQREAEAARLAAKCPGIELMGLYKNEIFDRAMGGGIVEWLAKVRNNASVTRIVVIGWRDSSGQQKSAQVQIPAGEIASPRVDMTQSRGGSPVSGLRILSCE